MQAAAADGAARSVGTLPPAQPKPGTPTRVLKPSLKQSRPAASKPSAASRPTKSSPPPPPPPSSASPSSLTKERLQANLQYYQFLTRVQSLLITTPASSPTTLQRASLVLRPSDYLEILSERSAACVCALPTCANPTSRSSGRYRLSLRQQRVWDVSEETLYCSPQCQQHSLDYLAELKDDPLYLRSLGEAIAQQQQPQPQQSAHSSPVPAHLEQGRVVEALHALPTPSPSFPSSTALAPPAGSDPSSLVIREAASTWVDPVFAGSSAAIEGYDRDARKVVRKKKAVSTPTSTTPSSTSAPALPSQSADELDGIAEVALQEAARRRSPMNPLASSDAVEEKGKEEADAGEVQSEEETKANFAAMRRARVLSPFAQLVGVLNHWVGDDTLSLLAEQGALREVLPSQSEVIRRRQEALVGLLRRELHALAVVLPLPPLSSLTNAVDSLALSFVANEQVPSLSSAQWQLILIVLLVTLQRTSKAAHHIDEAAAFTAVSSLGFHLAQLDALLAILLPFTPAPAPAPSPPPAPAPVAASAPPSMLSLPRDVLSSVLSFLPASDVPTASQLCHLLHLLAHPFASADLPLISHHTNLHTQRLHTVGYRDGLSDTRELLLQRAFDHALHSAYTRTVKEEAVKGVVAALAMWAWRAGDQDDEVWVRCDEVNAKVVRRPSSHRIQLEEEERTHPHTPLHDFCKQALAKAGVDGRQLLTDLSSWGADEAADEDVEALVAEQMRRLGIATPPAQAAGEADAKEQEDVLDFM